MNPTICPAYGRDYRSVKEIFADLAAGKDFIWSMYGDRWDGKPINLSQLRELGYRKINARYGKLRKVAVIDLPEVI